MRRVKKIEQEKKDFRAFNFREKMKEVQYLPEPTYVFKVGDAVELGNLEDVKIVEVFENGKAYEISFTSTLNNMGEKFERHDQRRFVSWVEIRPISTRVDHRIIKNEDLRIHMVNTPIMTLLGKLYHFRVNMNPLYQRDYVWNAEDNTRLIDSIFRNIAIGNFVFVKLPFVEGGFGDEILDGKQRLNAIQLFYENHFPYKGLFYNDLSRHERNHFENYLVQYAELSNITEQQKLRYFLMLNRSGRVMEESHLREIEKMVQGEI